MSKQDLLKIVETEIKACQKCGLWQSRNNTVAGEGNSDAAVIFIGEAPGYWEDLQGRPFVGAAGKLLDEMLLRVGLSRGEVYIGNILKCRPPDNRDPRPLEVKMCTPFLDRQIKIVEPKLIVSLGSYSSCYILSKTGLKDVEGITRLRGKVYGVDVLGLRILVIPTYHPAAALYNAKYRDGLKDDFRLLRRELEKLG